MKAIVCVKQVPDTSGKVAVKENGQLDRASMMTITNPDDLNAIEAAKAKGMKVIAMTGKDGGKMAGLADVEIRVPHFGYADRIQEIHIKVIHILMMLVEFEMAKEA